MKEKPKQTDEKVNPLAFWGGLAEPKQETLEEAAERLATASPKIFKEGAKWQQERSYSEQDMRKAFYEGHNVCRCVTDHSDEAMECFEEWFKQIKKK